MLQSQQFLEIEDIKEGVIILKNKGLRGVLLVSSINFDLKSEDEQKALIYQFQGFLNSLDFSCQIVVLSRRLNITGYFDKLKELEKTQENEFLKIQINEYRKFIEGIIGGGMIMSKEFLVVVPFSMGETIEMDVKKKNIFKQLFKSTIPILTEETFQRCREQLWQRMEFIAICLKRCGLMAVPLTTPELIELFWSLHHQQEAEFGYYPQILPELLK